MKQQGYTIIEMLVVVAIFGILLSIAISSIRGSGAKDTVKSEGERIVAVLRQARNRAFNGIINPAGGVYPSGGWGLYLDGSVTPRQYVLFADKSNDGVYDVDEAIATYNLASNVNISFRNANAGTMTKGTIIFDGDSFPKLQNVTCGDSLCLPAWKQHNSNVIFSLRISGNSCVVSVKFAPTTQGSSLRIEQSLSGC